MGPVNKKTTFAVARFTRDGKDENVQHTTEASAPGLAARKITNQVCRQLYGDACCSVELTITNDARPHKQYSYRATRELVPEEETVRRGQHDVHFKYRVRVRALKTPLSGS